MDRKSLLILGSCFILMLLWGPIVNKIYPPIPVPVSTNQIATATTNGSPGVTNAITHVSAETPGPVLVPQTKFMVQTNIAEELLVVTNDSARYTFTSRGGGLKLVQLLRYPESVSSVRKKSPTTNDLATLNALTSPPVAAIISDAALQGDGVFKLTTPAPGTVQAEKLLPNGLRVVKRFQLGKGYDLGLSVVFENQSTQAVSVPSHLLAAGIATPMGAQDNGQAETVFWHNGVKSDSVTESYFNTNTSSFFGLFARTPQSEYLAGSNNVAWVSSQNQFFTLGVIPHKPAAALTVHSVDLPAPTAEDLQDTPSAVLHPKGLLTMLVYPQMQIDADHSVTNQFTLFAGPKEYKTLAELASRFNNDFDSIMSFGWSGPISKTLLAAMNWVHSSFGLAYGSVIILITVVIKLVFWPLTQASTRSAKRMQALQPQLKELQEKYKDEPQKFTAKQWEFYKKNKVNPLSGCLPMLLQIPVFIGFYGMLWRAIELRGSSYWWMGDLSKPDTVFSLPIPLHFLGYGDLYLPINPMPLIMGVTIFFQASLTPPAPGMDPAQQKMMKYMPLIMLFFMYSQPSGLALYWTVSNLLTILQTKITKAQAGPVVASPAVSVAPQKKKK